MSTSHRKSQNVSAKDRFSNISQKADTTETLKNKVDEVESFIENLKAERAIKTGEFKVEISELEKQIEKTQKEITNSLNQAQANHSAEVSKLDEQFTKEESEMIEKIEAASSKHEVFAAQKSDLMRTRKESELADLKNRLQMLKIKAEERVLAANTVNAKVLTPEQLKRESDLRLKLDTLNSEIIEVRESNKQNKLDVKMKMKETEFHFQKRAEKTAKTIDITQDKVNHVREECEKSVSLAQADAEQSLQQMQSDLDQAKEKENLMKSMQQKMYEKYSTQANDMQKEIELTKSAIEESKTRIHEQAQEMKEQTAKLQELQKENAHLDASIAALQKEVDNLKADSESIKNEKSRIENDMFRQSISQYTSKSSLRF